MRNIDNINVANFIYFKGRQWFLDMDLNPERYVDFISNQPMQEQPEDDRF